MSFVSLLQCHIPRSCCRCRCMQVRALLDARREMVADADSRVDWAMAEALAVGTLLLHRCGLGACWPCLCLSLSRLTLVSLATPRCAHMRTGTRRLAPRRTRSWTTPLHRSAGASTAGTLTSASAARWVAAAPRHAGCMRIARPRSTGASAGDTAHVHVLPAAPPGLRARHVRAAARRAVGPAVGCVGKCSRRCVALRLCNTHGCTPVHPLPAVPGLLLPRPCPCVPASATQPNGWCCSTPSSPAARTWPRCGTAR